MIPISYNIRGLKVRKTSTLASGLGIAMVVFVLSSSLMLAQGIKATLGKSGSRDVAIVLRKGSDNEMASGVEESAVKLIMTAPGVKRDETNAPKAVAEIVVVIIKEKLGANGVTNIQVRGVPDNALQFRPNVHIVQGRPARPGTEEVIIGKRLHRRFKGMELNQSFELHKNKIATIVGIFEDGGSSYESEIWAGVDMVRSAFGRQGGASSVRVQLDSPSAFDGFANFVEQDKRLGLSVLRETKYLEKQSEGTSLFIGMMGNLITVFLSLGAMIGAMITMYSSIADRRREIGILRAIGFSRIGILFCFLLESVLLALGGGALGILGSLGMGFVRISMMNFASWSEIVFTFSPTPGILISSLLAAVLMGLLGGLLPALRAARISPIQAIRG